MKTMTPYLHFDGTAEEAMKFYKSILGGEFIIFQRYKDIPGGEKMPADQQEKIIHISLALGNGMTMMATDWVKTMEYSLIAGNNSHICIHTETEAEADKLFEGLSKAGEIDMPMNKTFWGAYFGMCRDKFGIYWMINYENKPPSK